MHDSTSQRNKALWVGSLALLTVGSVLYFTMLRKPEDSSKPAKDTKAREIVKERSTKPSQADGKETVKDDIPQLGDVPQAKATGTFEKEVTEIIDSIAAEPTPAQQDDTDAEAVAVISTTAADVTITATSTDITKGGSTLTDSDNEKTTAQQDNEKDDDVEDEEEKSPLLTAAPSSSSSSDIDSSALSEQREATKTAAAPTSADNNKNHSSSNGADLNGYWQPPATTATFQHSMGWPELFPLQQQQQEQETDEMKRATVATTLDTPAEVAPPAPAATGEKKKHTKKRMTRMEQIDQQRQNYVPTMKARCNWWPNCTNKNCKYHHPYQLCRYGDMCVYNERCMFLHPWDYEEPVRHAKQPQHTDN